MEGSQNYIGTPCGLVVCIDRVEGQRQAGRFYHFYSQEGQAFDSLDELVFGMEGLFDGIRFPYQSQKRRGFGGRAHGEAEKKNKEMPLGRAHMRFEQRDHEERRKIMDEEELLKKHGDLGTFIIRVQHRQNSSWQGRITWTDKNKTVNFRSIWEMVRLIGDALDTVSGPEDGEAKWP